MSRALSESQRWFERARKVIPGCAQTFSKGYTQYVQGVAPIFLQSGEGSRVTDVDGNSYIDFVQGLLPNILGYANKEVNLAAYNQAKTGHSFSLPHPLEVELAEKLCSIIPSAEMVRFGKNGSDATTGAVRLARAFTKREVVACCGYHGWHDWYIGSTTRNLGIPEAVCKLTQQFAYNNIESLDAIFRQHKDNVAAVIMEPMNFVAPEAGYLESVKELAHRNGALLIFDEICCGWHFGLGGAQKKFDVVPDLSCFGKAMGNGYPISTIVGRGDVMRLFEQIFVSFTFAGEVASMAAALKVIEIIEREPVVPTLERFGGEVKNALNEAVKLAGIDDLIFCTGTPQWSLIRFLDESGKDSLELKSLFQQEVVKRGLLILATHNMNYTFGESELAEVKKIYGEVVPLLANAIKEGAISKRLEGEPIKAIFKIR